MITPGSNGSNDSNDQGIVLYSFIRYHIENSAQDSLSSVHVHSPGDLSIGLTLEAVGEIHLGICR